MLVVSLPKRKAELDEIVNNAIQGATRLINMKSTRNWPGVFREMHKNLANIYYELHNYDRVHEECEKLKADYGETGRQDAEEVLEKFADKENGKTDSPEEGCCDNVTMHFLKPSAFYLLAFIPIVVLLHFLKLASPTPCRSQCNALA